MALHSDHNKVGCAVFWNFLKPTLCRLKQLQTRSICTHYIEQVMKFTIWHAVDARACCWRIVWNSVFSKQCWKLKCITWLHCTVITIWWAVQCFGIFCQPILWRAKRNTNTLHMNTWHDVYNMTCSVLAFCWRSVCKSVFSWSSVGSKLKCITWWHCTVITIRWAVQCFGIFWSQHCAG